MTTKHTPGPWIVSPDGDLPDRPYKVGKLMYCVADVGNFDDAKLIAAAPELLESLQELLKTIDECKQTESGLWFVDAPTSTSPNTKPVFDKIKAAILKATT